MRRQPQDQDDLMTRWLAAEAGDEADDAERALSDLFGAMPRPAVPAGLADRVLARVAAEPAPWPLERAALSLLLLCGVALAATPLWLPLVWERLDPGGWIEAGVDLLVRGAQVVAALAPVWDAVAKVARWLSLAGASPQVLALLAASTLLAAGAGRLLVAFLVEERSSGHAV
jgi:hypothetical protein